MMEPICCPVCGGDLHQGDPRLWRCDACGRMFPVLGGIPVLLPDMVSWVSGYRESILAALASSGDLDAATVDVVDAIRAMAPDLETLRFASDWDLTEDLQSSLELPDEPPPPPIEALLAADAVEGLWTRARVAVATWSGVIADVGSGVGRMTSALLCGDARRVVSVDNNLLAAMRCRDACEGADVLVADGCALPFEDGSLDGLVAMNLVDLLDSPEDFLEDAARVLKPGAPLLLATPDPSLGLPDGDAGRLGRCVEDAGFGLESVEDGLLWIRRPTRREYQVYVAQLLSAVYEG